MREAVFVHVDEVQHVAKSKVCGHSLGVEQVISNLVTSKLISD